MKKSSLNDVETSEVPRPPTPFEPKVKVVMDKPKVLVVRGKPKVLQVRCYPNVLHAPLRHLHLRFCM